MNIIRVGLTNSFLYIVGNRVKHFEFEFGIDYFGSSSGWFFPPQKKVLSTFLDWKNFTFEYYWMYFWKDKTDVRYIYSTLLKSYTCITLSHITLLEGKGGDLAHDSERYLYKGGEIVFWYRFSFESNRNFSFIFVLCSWH